MIITHNQFLKLLLLKYNTKIYYFICQSDSYYICYAYLSILQTKQLIFFIRTVHFLLLANPVFTKILLTKFLFLFSDVLVMIHSDTFHSVCVIFEHYIKKQSSMFSN